MNVALVGYGKMGKEIEAILVERGHKVALIIDMDNASDLNSSNLKEKMIDVAIEFSAPNAAFNNVVKCIEGGVPVVCGTTAWLDKLEDVEELCESKSGAFFYASNYSIGVNLMFKLNENLAKLMNNFPQYDVTVEEVHHTQKKDAPSGTAITIAEGIIENLDRKENWVGKTTTTPNELEVLAVRRSIVPGIHTVTYECDADSITLTHNARSRKGFAFGAVLAAEFIKGKSGSFSMDDLLNL